MVEQKVYMWSRYSHYGGRKFASVEQFLEYIIEKGYLIQSCTLVGTKTLTPEKALVIAIKNDENAKIQLKLG